MLDRIAALPLSQLHNVLRLRSGPGKNRGVPQCQAAPFVNIITKLK